MVIFNSYVKLPEGIWWVVPPYNPWYTPHGTACRATLQGATPQGLKNAALLEYDGTFEAGIAGGFSGSGRMNHGKITW